MDTSNKVSNDMTHVDPIDFILGSSTPIVPTTSLPTATWVIFLKRLIEKVKPHLKYFNNFKELGEFIKGLRYELIIDFDHEKIPYNKNITAKTRVLWITENKEYADYEDYRFLNKQIFLSDNGTFILMCMFVKKGDGDRARSVMFKTVDAKELNKLITEKPEIIVKFIQRLEETLREGVERRRGQLELLETLHASIHRANSIVKEYDICSHCGTSKEAKYICFDCRK